MPRSRYPSAGDLVKSIISIMTIDKNRAPSNFQDAVIIREDDILLVIERKRKRRFEMCPTLICLTQENKLVMIDALSVVRISDI